MVTSLFYMLMKKLLELKLLLVFKLMKDSLEKNLVVFGYLNVAMFQKLINMLPSEHKARWFAGAALNSSEQAMASVMSTALSRLNAFIDSELEQILCFDTSIDVEEFCSRKSAIYLVLPEEDATKHFLISLIFQQLYREMLTVADERGGQLEKRVMFYADEIGTLPKIDGLEMIFSASRSRKISIVAIIQSLAFCLRVWGVAGNKVELLVFQGDDSAFVVMFLYAHSITYAQRLVLGIDGSAGISFFLSIVPVTLVALKLQVELSFLHLGFLQAEKVCIELLELVLEVLAHASTQAIYVPGYKP